jgi:ABC-type polysaccharide/polyol phosphate export permease
VEYIAVAVLLTVAFTFIGSAVFFRYEKKFPEML